MTNTRSDDPAPSLSRLTLWGTARIALAHAGRLYDERLTMIRGLDDQIVAAIAAGDADGAAAMQREANVHHEAMGACADRLEYVFRRAIAAEQAHRAKEGLLAEAPVVATRDAAPRIRGRIQ